MLPKKLNNVDEYEKLNFEAWTEMFLLNYYLVLEECLINIEDLYKRKSLLSSFKIVAEPTRLIVHAYDVYGNPIEDEDLHSQLIANVGPLVIGDERLLKLFSLFATIKRPERYDLYKNIVGHEFYNRIVDSWKENISIDISNIPKKTYEDVTYPLYLVSKEQVESDELKIMKEKFMKLNSRFAYLKCQQFFLVIDNLFKKNEKLTSVAILFDDNNQLEVNINFKEENTQLDQESASKITPFVMEALNVLAERGKPLIFESDKLKEGYLEAYGNILKITGVDPQNEELNELMQMIIEL